MTILLTAGFLTVFLTAGFLSGCWFLTSRARRRTPRPPEPMCGCGHHYALHDLTAGRCHDVYRDLYVTGGKRDELEPCHCRHYCGPEPLPSYFAQELT